MGWVSISNGVADAVLSRVRIEFPLVLKNSVTDYEEFGLACNDGGLLVLSDSDEFDVKTSNDRVGLGDTKWRKIEHSAKISRPRFVDSCHASDRSPFSFYFEPLGPPTF